MSVGLYDVDFFKYHQVMFNLELMKMATYFKKQGEITVLSPTLSPERYTRFYLRKDFIDGTFPSGIYKYDNVECGGLAYSGNILQPLDNSIENCIPDTSIYEKYSDLFIDNKKVQQAAFTSLINNFHLRISLDGKTVWNDLEKQIPKGRTSNILFFHDKNLGEIEQDFETVRYLLEKYSRKKEQLASIGTKFPVNCKDYETFLKWNNFTFNDSFFTIKINSELTDEELVDLVTNNSNSHLQKVKYTIATPSSSKDDFIDRVLPKIFKQVIFCCMNKKRILLNIDDNFIIEEEWRKLITLLNMYMAAAQEYYCGLAQLDKFCSRLWSREHLFQGAPLGIEDAREIFWFVREKNFELFKMFYQCNQVELVGGNLI